MLRDSASAYARSTAHSDASDFIAVTKATSSCWPKRTRVTRARRSSSAITSSSAGSSAPATSTASAPSTVSRVLAGNA